MKTYFPLSTLEMCKLHLKFFQSFHSCVCVCEMKEPELLTTKPSRRCGYEGDVGENWKTKAASRTAVNRYLAINLY